MSIDKGDRVRINSTESSLAYINGRIATVTTSNRSGYYLQVDGLKPLIHLSNLQGIECLDKLTSAQESALALPLPDSKRDLTSKDSQKETNSAPKYSASDTPELQIMATSNNGKRGRGRPRKDQSISSPPAPPANPSPIKETASAKTTPEIVYPTSEASLNKLTPRTGRSRTSPAYSASIKETISENSSNGLTTAGMTVNGSLLAADTLEAPILENDYLFLESPGALGEGILGNNPPRQNKLEGQLKQNGSIAPREVSNPEFLEASLGLPVGWTDPQENATATELRAEIEQLENVVKPSEISLTPESPSLRSIVSSTTPKQLDLTSRIQWVDLDQLEEVSYTQIRHSIDGEAITRYAELMRDCYSSCFLIGDLQTKVAQLEQGRAELALTIRDKITLAVLDFEQASREFQISQEIALRSEQQHEIYTLSYRFGSGNTQQFLSQQNTLDRSRASVYREWTKVQRQLELLKIMVFPQAEEE